MMQSGDFKEASWMLFWVVRSTDTSASASASKENCKLVAALRSTDISGSPMTAWCFHGLLTGWCEHIPEGKMKQVMYDMRQFAVGI